MSWDPSMLPRHVLAAAVLLRDTAGRVLLVETPYRAEPVLPGGVVEDGESPATAAGREVHEETGLTIPVGRLLVVQAVPARPDRPATIQFVFATPAVPVDGPLVPQPGEVAALRWWTPVDAVRQTAAWGADRLAAALRCEADGSTAYLDGPPADVDGLIAGLPCVVVGSAAVQVPGGGKPATTRGNGPAGVGGG
ncbi:NUDIX domain-containing protein [Nakamurella leprariae]|uniref:NUDIX hydrolase n=1 Tax=Nakamurella leprariae TaxID=2803911 RepID=A0A938YA91_9ACTN|nr:NUDIX hydrolase [Nakamurella leprariae]MBM9468826.1 NUDIX hydrolase [Nakamurella leprariae]